jgi:hypothetical protein
MNDANRPNREPGGISTLDLLLFTAGFACGWVMHQGSALRTGQFYILPLSRGGFHSLLGMVWSGWLWAFVIGLAFLIVARRFRYDCRNRPAEWLAVALAIVLFESVFPAFRTERVGSMTGEAVWIEASADSESEYAVENSRDRPHLAPERKVMYDLWWPKPGESWVELSWVAIRLAAAAVMIAMIVWRFRARLSPGWITVLLIVMAVLIALGPIRLAEAMSIDVTSSRPNPGYRPTVGEKPWSWPRVAAYFEARAWGGYSIRALALVTLAMLAVRSLFTRWRNWLWTEWAAVLSAAIFGGCWIYDEFVARPALDRTVRVAMLGTSLLLLAVVAGVLMWVGSALRRRTRSGSIGDARMPTSSSREIQSEGE